MNTYGSVEFPMPAKVAIPGDLEINDPIQRVLVIGHGDLAVRQRPTYEHWINQGVEVHCADVDPTKLDDCLEGVQRYDLSDPSEARRLLSVGYDGYDLLLVNNFPGIHLATALTYSAFAKHIIIQKPQDLNYPLIRTIQTAAGFEGFRRKVKVHDHYRNKDSVPALLQVLPQLHRDYGRFQKLAFFLTESKDINDEEARAGSLDCGMIQDLAVHMFDLLFETIAVGTQWTNSKEDERLHKRVGGTIRVVACPQFHRTNSILGDHVETFAAIDMNVTEKIEFLTKGKNPIINFHSYDVLIVVGKGLSVEDGVTGDLKVIAAEFERPGFDIKIDLSSHGTVGIQNYLPSGREINRRHGGMNRPLMLISPNTPKHALEGFGAADHSQWQTLQLSGEVAFAADVSKKTYSQSLPAYPPGRALGDFIRELATGALGAIRPIWGNFRPLSTYMIKLPKSSEYYD